MFLFSSPGKSDDVTSALQLASRRTGVDVGYLKATARRESSFDPKAKAATSSASGLFQFIERTWLSVLKQTGARHGYGELADKIEATGNGYRVADPAARREILALRHDPKAAALMAGELTARNAEDLRTALGRPASEGELYAAHFLGAQGAVELVRLAETAPSAPANERFPAAAAANRSMFYGAGGRALSASEVYGRLTAGFDATPAIPENARYLAFAAGRQSEDHVFHGLFTSGGSGLGPIGRSVSGFWSGFPARTAAYGLTEDPKAVRIETTGATGGATREVTLTVEPEPAGLEIGEAAPSARRAWTVSESTQRYGQWKDEPSLPVP